MSPENKKWWGDLIKLSGDPLEYIELLYSHFSRDFIESKPAFEGQQVHHDRNDDGGKCACFVHITSKDEQGSGGRVIDLRRCERLHWIRPIIENHTADEVLRWEEVNRKGKRVFLYLADERYVVILQSFKYGFMLVTAYYVEHEGTHQRYLKKYEQFYT